ncbi:MAG: glycosyltransferase family 9 protein [Planctomycetota bacterium]
MPSADAPILVFRYGTLGDTLVAVPSLAALAAAFPRRPLHYMTSALPSDTMIAPRAVLEPTGMIAGFLEYRSHDGFLRNRARVRNYVRECGINTLLYLPQPERPVAAILRDRVFFAACGLLEIVGFDEALRTARARSSRIPRLALGEARRLLDIVARMGAPPPQSIPLGIGLSERETIDRLWDSRSLHGRPVVAVCTGGKTPHQRWPENRYVEVCRLLRTALDVAFVAVGGASDRPAGERICRALDGAGFNACGELSVWECAEVLRRCDLYLGNDTGTMHLAALVGTRCVVPFSFHNLPGTWFPWGSGHVVLQKRVPCGPCLAETCPRPVCLEAITVAAVADAARAVLLETRMPCVESPVSAAL